LKKIAIVSTYDDLCGIAGYTKALVRQLKLDYEITVFDLDQYLLRSTVRPLRKLGDALIIDIVGKLSDFDAVNIQLEHGTLGATHTDIVRRFEMLAGHDKPLTVTFHTVLPIGGSGVRDLLRALRRLDRRSFFEILSEMRVGRELGYPIMKLIAARQGRARTSTIFHTRRDARSHRLLYKLKRVLDHPLAFYSQEGALAAPLLAMPRPSSIERTGNPVVLGVFGFISPYKGLLTAIQAMRRLPEHYHLMIFGGLHPNDIRKGHSVNPYLERMLDLITDGVDQNSLGRKAKTPHSMMNMHLDNPETLRQIMNGVNDISNRVHFMGTVKDEEFASAIQACDVVVLPYDEVGQSSSGPLSIASDVGARIVCTRNKAFLQYDRYNPGRLNFFDIGNHLELAQRVVSVMESPPLMMPLRYTVETNRAVYKASFDTLDEEIDLLTGKLAGKHDHAHSH
jgi:glycosyltransferase involved in cell wall biosynthesis